MYGASSYTISKPNFLILKVILTENDSVIIKRILYGASYTISKPNFLILKIIVKAENDSLILKKIVVRD